MDVSSSVAYLKVVDSGKPSESKGRDRIYVDDIWIVSKSANTPFAAGDAKTSRWGKTNLGVYGSAQVGILAGIVNKTNVKGILQLDCLATDFHRYPAYPTYLYYNPHDAPKAITSRHRVLASPKEVEIELGKAPRDLYETVGDVFVARAASGKARVTIPPKSGRVIVICPAGGKLVRSGTNILVNGVVIDYR